MNQDYEPTRPSDERIVKDCIVMTNHYRFSGRAYFIAAYLRPHLQKVVCVCETLDRTCKFTVDELNVKYLSAPKQK